MRSGLATVALVPLLASGSPAHAFGLTEADQTYLATHNIELTSTVVRDLSPREQARLHAVINDAASAGNEAARASAVTKALEEFRERQVWEAADPHEVLRVRQR